MSNDDFFKDSGSSDSKSPSIAWIESKGFYELLSRTMNFIVAKRLDRDFESWFNGLDSLATFTRPYWSKKSDFNKFETLYFEYMNLNNTYFNAKGNLSRSSIRNGLFLKVRSAEQLLMSNINHLFLKFNESGDEDLAGWFSEDDYEKEEQF